MLPTMHFETRQLRRVRPLSLTMLMVRKPWIGSPYNSTTEHVTSHRCPSALYLSIVMQRKQNWARLASRHVETVDKVVWRNGQSLGEQIFYLPCSTISESLIGQAISFTTLATF